jgi:cytochrome b6-f complex iron-sulfur subunit
MTTTPPAQAAAAATSRPDPVGADLLRSTPNRRQALVAVGLGAGALTLAACGSSSTPAAASPTPATSAAAASSADTIVALSSVPVGGAVAAKDAAGKPIIVAQPTAGKAVAFSAICTHMHCTVAVKGADLDCPCHGSKYNALTGAVINGPAPKPLPSVAVEVKGGNVVAG